MVDPGKGIVKLKPEDFFGENHEEGPLNINVVACLF